MLMMAGCTKNVGTTQDNASANLPEEDETPVQKSYKIGFSVIDMENPYFITLETAAREYLEEQGCTMVTKDPGTDQYLQSKQIQEMIDEGIDAIILTPVNWEEITSSLKVLKDNDIKIINVDAQVKHMDYVDAYIGSDNYSAGYLIGTDLIEKCPDGGEIVILECPTQNSMNDRITGFEEAISKASKGFEIVAREDTQGEFEKALDAAMRILEEHPKAVANFIKELEASVKYAVENKADAGTLCEKHGIVPKAALATKAIPNCNLTVIKGKEMKPAIEGYFEVLYSANKTSVGGNLPDEEFYYIP